MVQQVKEKEERRERRERREPASKARAPYLAFKVDDMQVERVDAANEHKNGQTDTHSLSYTRNQTHTHTHVRTLIDSVTSLLTVSTDATVHISNFQSFLLKNDKLCMIKSP
eukprot:3202527-Pleurochrysis_carterae.AAC.1